MRPLGTRIATAFGVMAAAAGTVVIAAPTASAATYNGACGSGYVQVNSAPIGTVGTVFLTYNSSNGQNCVVTQRNSSGSPTTMCEELTPAGGSTSSFCEPNVTTWGGPLYVHAPGVCVSWKGIIGSVSGGKNNTNCG